MIHGNPAMVARGCPCNLCVLVRENPRARTAPQSVPARRVADHIGALLAEGWTIATLAEHVGYGPSTLYAIRSGRWQFTSRLIAEDILSVPIKETAA